MTSYMKHILDMFFWFVIGGLASIMICLIHNKYYSIEKKI